MRKLFKLLLLGMVLTAWHSAPARAQETAPEYVLKAAFIYNFAAFTDWPPGTGNSLNLCIVGKNPFGNALDSLEGKPLGAMRFAIKQPSAGESLRGCQILFISASEHASIGKLLEGIRGSAVLTIAEGGGVAQQGVIIGLIMEQKKIAFEVNLEAARRSQLSISSKLLRLARTVY